MTAVQGTEPRMVEAPALLIAGLERAFTFENMREIPQMWGRFVPFIGNVPGEVEGTTYGVCNMQEGGLRYLAGVEVERTEGLPEGFTSLTLPAGRYAVFSHSGSIANLCETIDAMEAWAAQREMSSSLFFERYGPGFNPATGTGDIEIWVPFSLREEHPGHE